MDLDLIEKLFNKSNRIYSFHDIIKLPYFQNWLVGFTAAEGSFHLKGDNLKPHYSIVQSGHENSHLIKAIHYFIKGPESVDYVVKLEAEKVYRISFSSKKDLNTILNFFEGRLLGLKKIQFDNWKRYLPHFFF